MKIVALPAVLAVLAVGCARPAAQEKAAPAEAPKAAAPAKAAEIPSNPLKEAYFGEQHLHTAYSLDAYIGGARLTPSDAYRFAKGEEVEVGGTKVQLRAPLDWAAVTDHAEYLGEMYSTMNEGARVTTTPSSGSCAGSARSRSARSGSSSTWSRTTAARRPSTRRSTPVPRPRSAAGRRSLAAAEEHNKPGTFTTIPAFEWSAAPKGGNLHRNVFFRDTNVPDRPMSYVDINREEGLWAWMAGLEKQGMKVIAIPHNSNASKGMMFPATDSAGEPIDLEYAEMRSRFEPLIEMMQIKGNSEVHRWFWAADEFAELRERRLARGVQRPGPQEVRQAELGPLGRDEGPRIRAVARREPVPLRLRGRHGQPQRHARRTSTRTTSRPAATGRPTARSSGAGRARSAAGSRART